MARIARVVAPKYPHHIVQRGNRRQKVFFLQEDYELYLRLLKFYSQKFNLKVVSYCLMPNHVHLIVIPEQKQSLAQAIGETHRNYTTIINKRELWTGYLWQGRFYSHVLDERYLIAAVRYVLLNPVRASLVGKAKDYAWSSIKIHLKKQKNSLVKDDLLQEIITDWHNLLANAEDEDISQKIRKHSRTGRPLGGQGFVKELEEQLNIKLAKQKPGRKTRT
ncbi:MAG: transposase [Candidatus Omnitrophica bacterium]|nr:transposase [Candidatus Omnitrophota bacterium]